MSAADQSRGIVLEPFRAVRPSADGDALARLLCPPYDVIDAAERAELVARDPDNAVTVILPEPEPEDGADRYQAAAQRLDRWVHSGTYVVDEQPTLYVYEMRDAGGSTTRGLIGALELRDPADGVILPHENTMAGPVADRLALMSATETNVEAIYLVYDGGGAASAAVRSVEDVSPLAQATTPDGITHRLWALVDADVHRAVADDLRTRRALIADGHHRYATYRELQQQLRGAHGAGPWDYGLTLLVDSTSYGPQVHAIHRVLLGRTLADAADPLAAAGADLAEVSSPSDAIAALDAAADFAVALTDGARTVVVTDPDRRLRASVPSDGATGALADLDVTVLHRGMVEQIWGLEDSVATVGYAHSVDEAITAAKESDGTAVLLRPTPVTAVAAVAAAGGRMPRKSTLFTPKPASGVLMRRFADAGPGVPS
jgi:uncharacterized protein (DUF1015 family)